MLTLETFEKTNELTINGLCKLQKKKSVKNIAEESAVMKSNGTIQRLREHRQERDTQDMDGHENVKVCTRNRSGRLSVIH